MVLNTDAIKRDYQRLNALNFFSKVEPDVRPGPDPKKPQDVTRRLARHRTAYGLGFGRLWVFGRLNGPRPLRDARSHR